MGEAVQSCFKRHEKKYLLTGGQYQAMLAGMEAHMEADRYSRYSIFNIYYDTEDYRLISASLEGPVYKEKLRVRSYGSVYGSGSVFVELKKKFDGVVYKRRVTAGAADAARWLSGGKSPGDSQIHREIDWFIKSLRPVPKAFIGYEREAYAGKALPDLRVTFDTALRGRSAGLDLRCGGHGALILPEESILMEVKIPGAAPLWLASLLSANEIFPVSFSKYGTYYRDFVLGGKTGEESLKKEVLKSA